MKNLYTLITSLFLGTLSLQAQYSVVYDNTWLSDTESSLAAAFLDDENNIYVYIAGAQVLNGNQQYKYLQKIGANNQVLWTKQNGVNLHLECVGFDENNYPLIWSIINGNYWLVRIDKNSGNRLDSLSFGQYGGGFVEKEPNGDYLLRVGINFDVYRYRLNSNRELIWVMGNMQSGSVKNSRRMGNRYYFYHQPLNGYSKIYYQNLNNGQFQEVQEFGTPPNRLFFNDDTTAIGLYNSSNIYSLLKYDLNDSYLYDYEVLIEPLSPSIYQFGFQVQNKQNFYPNNGSYSNGTYQTGFQLIDPYVLNEPFYKRKQVSEFFTFGTGYARQEGQYNLKIHNWSGGISFNYDTDFIINPIAISKSNTDCILITSRIMYEGLDNARLVKICSATASTTELETTNFTLYPNPTNTEFTIQFEETTSIPSSVRLLDISGKEVLQQETKLAQELTLDVRKLAPGTYFLQAGNVTQKVVVE